MKIFRYIGLAIMTALIAHECSAQSDSAKVIKYEDEMTNQSFYTPSKNIPLISPDNSSGFAVSLGIEQGNGKLVADGIRVKMFSMGSCCEKSELIVMFEDSTKFTLVSWNKFNCEGNAWFNLTDNQIKQLSEKPLLKIRLMNGYTFDSLTSEVSEGADEYFINLFEQMSANLYTVKKE